MILHSFAARGRGISVPEQAMAIALLLGMKSGDQELVQPKKYSDGRAFRFWVNPKMDRTLVFPPLLASFSGGKTRPAA